MLQTCDLIVLCVAVSGGAAYVALAAAADSSRLKKQAQQRRQQQARLPDSQAKATAAAVDKQLFGPPIQVLSCERHAFCFHVCLLCYYGHRLLCF